MTHDDAFDAYLDYLENLTAQDISRLGDYVSPDTGLAIHFMM